MLDTSQFNTDRTYAGRWTITFSNPPINIFGPTTIVELGALMTDLEADASVKVVVFQSANPDFFIAHLDVSKAAERPKVVGLWRDFVLRLSSTPVVSIAKIRGRTRGIGNEFELACDMRFASRQSALSGRRIQLKTAIKSTLSKGSVLGGVPNRFPADLARQPSLPALGAYPERVGGGD